MKMAALCAGAAIALVSGTAMGWTHDFESAGGYGTSVAEFTDGGFDFWLRTDGSDHSGGVVYDGDAAGNFYFAGMDIDGEGATPPLVQTFSGIDISSFSSLLFSVDLAEDDDGSNEDWDLDSDMVSPSDIVSFEYQIDGGGYQSIFDVIAQNPTSTNGYSNGEPSVNGTAVTNVFTTFSQALTGTGSLLDLRITWDLDAGDEDLAIDNLAITPTPGTMGLLALGGLAGVRRRRA